MQVDVRLEYQHGYKWHTQNGISVKGYAWNAAGALLREEELAHFFEDLQTAQIESALNELNGLFSVIVHRNDTVLFAVDRTRTFPLFYTEKDGKLIVSDSAYEIAGHHFFLQESALQEFSYTGYVTGADTFFEDIYQVQAGAYVVVNTTTQQRFYHIYAGETKTNLPLQTQEDHLAKILDQTAQRLIATLGGRMAVLPLSGGYDSRLIACMLKKYNYNNVVCFTYGSRLDREVHISKKVAAQLEFKWHYINYSDQQLRALLMDDELNEYIPFCTNGASAVFLQDFYAVKALRQKRLIADDSVFVPGHTGDFISGGHLIPGLTKINVADAILKRHYALKTGDKAAFQSRVTAALQNISPAENFEHWNLKERQAKFIVNSNRAYEFQGHQHLMPLWDKDLIFFFQHLDHKYKLGRVLYDRVLFTHFFQPFDVAIKKNRHPYVVQKISGIFRRAYRWTCRDNYNFRFTATHFAQNRKTNIRWNSTTININSILAAWLVAKLRDNKNAGDARAPFRKWF